MQCCCERLLVLLMVVNAAQSAHGLVGETLPYDFNGSGAYDVGDIDMLTAEIRQGIPDLRFDIAGNGVVDSSDLLSLIQDAFLTRLGDANLDFAVTASGDGAILLSNLGGQQGNKSWGDGDFDADLHVTASADGSVLLANLGFSADMAAPTIVPEPGSLLLVTVLVLATCCVCVFHEWLRLARYSRHKGRRLMRYCPAELLIPIIVAFLAATANGDFALPGDFNGDGRYDIGDIDMLTAAIHNSPNDVTFNLNGTEGVESDDLIVLIEDLMGTRLGDANLDFAVTASGDGAILLSNLGGQQGNKSWGNGDFDADLHVTARTADGSLLLANLGFSADMAAPTIVPEPGSLLLVTVLMLATCCVCVLRGRFWGAGH